MTGQADKHLHAAFVEEPNSQSICDELNARGAIACEHNRNPCYLRCRVARVANRWKVVPRRARDRWLERVCTND